MMRKIFLLIVCMMVLSGSVLAFEFDNKKIYNKSSGEYSIVNLWGAGRVLANIKLNTPQVNRVIDRGDGIKQMVGEFTISSTGNYNNALKDIQFYNLRLNNKEFDKDFEYRKKIYFDVDVKDYEVVCDERTVSNGTEKYNCTNVEIGSHIEQRFRWEEFNIKDLQEEDITLGIFLDVKPLERGDWIPTLFGKRLDKWAEWNEGLSDGLFAYYTFDNTTESTRGGGYNLTVSAGDPIFGSGEAKIGSSGIFDGDDAFQEFTHTEDFEFYETGNASVFGWVFINTSTTTSGIWGSPSLFRLIRGSTDKLSFIGGCDDLSSLVSTDDMVNEIFYFVGFRTNGTHTSLWLNGTEVDSCLKETYVDHAEQLVFGNDDGGFLTGHLDEFGFWNRSLSDGEILDLYNSGNGLTYSPFTVSLDIPTNNSKFSNSSGNNVTFNLTAKSNNNIVENLSLIINGVRNTTITDGTDGFINITISLEFEDGVYNWTGEAYNNLSAKATATNRTFLVDTILPTINITFPNTTIGFHKLTDPLNLNWTINDTNLQACFFEYNGANTTVTCSDNGTTFTPTLDNLTLNLWANDSVGNLFNDSITLEYHILEINQSFVNDTLEGSLQTFNLSIRTNGSTLTIANLKYNNSVSALGIITDQGEDNFFVTAQINIPNVDSNINQSFYWDLQLADSFRTNSSTNNQTVRAITLDTCTSNTVLILNYTLRDEGTQGFLTGSTSNTSIKVNLNIFPVGSSNSLLNFSQNYTEVNPAQVCLNINLTTDYRMDVITEYDSDPRVIEFHHIQNFTLQNSSVPQLIDLYDLQDDDSQEFKITFKDNQFSLVEDALIDITRLYVEDGIFRSVELPKTGSSGQTIGHFVLADVIYTIIVSKEGQTLATFENVIATCEDPTIQQCELNLNAFSTGTPPTDFSTVNGLSFTTTLNKSTRILKLIFTNSPSGSVATVSLNATKFDALGNSTICSSQVTSSSGTIQCTVPDSFGNVSIETQVFKNGNLISYKFFQIEESAQDIFGLDGIIFLLILLISLPLMAMGSKIVMMISAFLTFIIAALLNIYQGGSYIGVGSTLVWGIIALSIIVWKLGVEGE